MGERGGGGGRTSQLSSCEKKSMRKLWRYFRTHSLLRCTRGLRDKDWDTEVNTWSYIYINTVAERCHCVPGVHLHQKDVTLRVCLQPLVWVCLWTPCMQEMPPRDCSGQTFWTPAQIPQALPQPASAHHHSAPKKQNTRFKRYSTYKTFNNLKHIK